MLYKLYNGDCLDIMQYIKPDFVDFIFCDLPFGVTNNKWDIKIPFDKLWYQYKRIIKPNGVIVLNAVQPFTSALVMSNLEMFKYEIIWEKTISSNQLNVKKQPLRSHESILVFYKGQPTYNEHLEQGTPYSIKRNGKYLDGNYNKQKKSEKINTGYRHARSVIKISNPRVKGGHPTQKPLELCDHIISIFTNKDDIILDNCMGSGSTGVSALSLGRKFIGIEKDNKWFEFANNRIKEAIK